jgi:hypothetical protein
MIRSFVAEVSAPTSKRWSIGGRVRPLLLVEYATRVRIVYLIPGGLSTVVEGESRGLSCALDRFPLGEAVRLLM